LKELAADEDKEEVQEQMQQDSPPPPVNFHNEREMYDRQQQHQMQYQTDNEINMPLDPENIVQQKSSRKFEVSFDDLIEKGREPMIVAAIVLVINSELFQTHLSQYVPSIQQGTMYWTVMLSVIAGALFFAIKKFT
jgi:hypothetical protein